MDPTNTTEAATIVPEIKSELIDQNELISVCMWKYLNAFAMLQADKQANNYKGESEDGVEDGVENEDEDDHEIPSFRSIERILHEAEKKEEISGESINLKAEFMSKIFPEKVFVPSHLREYIEQSKALVKDHHQQFILSTLDEYPVNISSQPNKARKYITPGQNPHKSKVSRQKNKVQHFINIYTICYLREQILHHEAKMSMLREIILQNNTTAAEIGEEFNAAEVVVKDEIESAPASVSPNNTLSMSILGKLSPSLRDAILAAYIQGTQSTSIPSPQL